MNILEYKKNLSKAFSGSADYVKKIGFTSAYDNIMEIKKSFEEKEIMIVTVGEMKRGKSLLQNGLLGETVFPVDMNVCTNVVTVVRYGSVEKIEVVLEEFEGDEYKLVTKEIKREEIPEYVSEQFNAANHKNVKLLNVEIPNALLKERIVFVDTPGVGSLNISHAETTYGFLPNADLLLFVSDSVAPLTETELDFLKEGYKYCKNIIFPLTKKDLNAEYMEIAEGNREKICSALEISEDAVSVIPVSSKAKMKYLETGSERMLRGSNFEELENVIWSTIAQKRIEITVIPFIEAVNSQLYTVAESIAAQHQILVSNKENFPKLQKQLEEEMQKYKEFIEDGSDWQMDLDNKFNKMRNSNMASLRDACRDAAKLVEAAKEEHKVNLCEESCYTAVYNDINKLFCKRILDIKADMLKKADEAVNEVNETLGLNVSSYKNALKDMGFTPESGTITVRFPERSTVDKIGDGGRKITTGMMSFGKVGAVAGAVAAVGIALITGPAALAAVGAEVAISSLVGTAASGAVYGGLAGTVFGGAKGSVDAIINQRDVDVPYVVKALNEYIDSTRNKLELIISNSYNDLCSEAKKEIKKQIRKKNQELKDSIKRIEDMVKSSVPDDKKILTLEKESENIDKQINSYLEFDKVYGDGSEDVASPKSDTEECSEYSFM